MVSVPLNEGEDTLEETLSGLYNYVKAVDHVEKHDQHTYTLRTYRLAQSFNHLVVPQVLRDLLGSDFSQVKIRGEAVLDIKGSSFQVKGNHLHRLQYQVHDSLFELGPWCCVDLDSEYRAHLYYSCIESIRTTRVVQGASKPYFKVNAVTCASLGSKAELVVLASRVEALLATYSKSKTGNYVGIGLQSGPDGIIRSSETFRCQGPMPVAFDLWKKKDAVLVQKWIDELRIFCSPNIKFVLMWKTKELSEDPVERLAIADQLKQWGYKGSPGCLLSK